MKTRSILYARDIPITKEISVVIPRVGEILVDQDAYYNIVSILTSMPIDMCVQLDDIGIDFTQINEYQLFLLMFNSLKEMDTSLVFGDLDLTKFQFALPEGSGLPILIDAEKDIRITRVVYNQIAATLRKIHHFEKNNRKPANEAAKKYMIERARVKQRRNKNRVTDSQLESLIIAMVNTEQFKYDFEGTLELSIYQFNESVRQIIHKVSYDQRMSGVYAGTVDAKSLSQDDLNWLTHK